MRAMVNQTREIRDLSAEIVVNANEPIRKHMLRSFTDAWR
jgi:hypothetical protein